MADCTRSKREYIRRKYLTESPTKSRQFNGYYLRTGRRIPMPFQEFYPNPKPKEDE